jgi:transcription elongation factor Elf1
MQKTKPYTIDLTKVNGNGTFNCPKCGIQISPDDTSENAYTIIEPIVKEDSLEKILLQCNNCQSRIRLIGFNALSEKTNRQN